MAMTTITHQLAPGQRPPLRLEKPEEALLRRVYGAAGVILEYGSGGSTLLAADLAAERVFSVESDVDWMHGMAAWFAENPPRVPVHLHHGDIGPTGKWGSPTGNRAWARFHHYPLEVWERPDFVHPDVVLIDGRFRIGCFLTVLFRATRPVTVLFDDYVGRATYHVVERYLRPAEIAGRMARFDVTPRSLDPADLMWIMDQFTLPR